MKRIFLSVFLSQILFTNTFGQVNLTKNLVCHFPFSNNLTDVSGQGTIATKYNGGPSFGFDRESEVNSALSFNGNGGLRINASNNVLNFGTTTNMTMSFWFKTSSEFYTRLYNDNGMNRGISITLNQYVEGELLFSVRGSNSTDRVELEYTDSKFFNNQWHHLVFILNQTGKTLNLYVDGSLKKSVNYSGKSLMPLHLINLKYM